MRANTIEMDYNLSGKEVQKEINLDWIGFGARMYMPDPGRGGGDPMATKYMKNFVFFIADHH